MSDEPPSPGRGGRARRARLVLRGVLAVLVVTASAVGAGLGLASAWESTASDADYRVTTRLTARSQVEVPTNLGTATFDTHAWGPGARVAVSALSLPPVERASGSSFIDLPGELAKIRALAVEAGIRSLQKFAAGAVLGGVLGALAWWGLTGAPGASRRRRLLAAVAGGSTAGIVVLAGWGAGAYLTFDDRFGQHLQADGLLAIGLSADDLLRELDSRDQAYAGYVQSLATYISRLRDEASPPEAGEVAVRALLVSDIHGRDVYAQLAGVVETQDIDVVVDTGDLVQWGTRFELSARPDITDGIESLGVPYVWVKGNHDGPGTVAQMRELSNVVVLDGDEARVAGLRLVGVGDPRLYQDGGPTEAEHPDEVEEIERAAAARAAGSLRGEEDAGAEPDSPDVALMHHPAGARELGALTGARVWVSGHTHRPALAVEADHVDVTVGTTGAAGLRTFNGQDAAGDVVATPQSFDILDFGPACDPVSITRFTYPDVLSEAGAARVSYETIRLEEGPAVAEGAGSAGAAEPSTEAGPEATDDDSGAPQGAARCG